jgi:hypothetical protein
MSAGYMSAAARTVAARRLSMCREKWRPSILERAQHERPMSPNADTDEEDLARQERTIRSLTERAGAPIEHVRGLFMKEYSRLGRGAKVRRFLHLLTTSNVREMLRASVSRARMR